MASNQFTLPTAYTGAGLTPTSTFNPANANSFLNNFNQASVLYGTGLIQDEQQANDLIAAYQYLSDPANQATVDAENGAGYSQYMLGQLQNDIAEQVNMVNLAQGQQSAQTEAQQFNTLTNTLSNIQGGQGGNLNVVTNADWTALAQALAQNGNPTIPYATFASGGAKNITLSSAIQGALQNNGKDPATGLQLYQIAQLMNKGDYVGNLLGALTKQNTSAQQALQPLQQAATTGFTLNSPYYQGGQQQLQKYYFDPTTGQVPLSAQSADQDLYKMAYQQKQQLTAAANQMGVSGSGEKRLAIGNVNSNAAKQAANLYQQSANQAQQAIDNYNQDVQKQQAQQTALTQDVVKGDINNLFNSSTQQNISDYNANQGAQNEQALQSTQQDIQQAQQNSNLWNQIFGQGGQGVGQAVGTLIGSLI